MVPGLHKLTVTALLSGLWQIVSQKSKLLTSIHVLHYRRTVHLLPRMQGGPSFL